MDIDVAIQELVDRGYQAGVFPESRKEVTLDLSDAAIKTTWEDYPVVLIAIDGVDAYDAMLKVRDNEKPYSVNRWAVVDVDVEHQVPGGSKGHFVDHGIHQTADGPPTVHKRVYQVPEFLKDSTDVVRALMRIKAPTIDEDTDVIPLKSIYTAKLGLMAIGYENEGDQRAQQAWQTFYQEMGLNQKRSDGIKRRHVKLDFGLRHKPNNFG
jgi:hypothetical protein